MSMVYMTYAHLLHENGNGEETLLGIRQGKSQFAPEIRSGPGGGYEISDKGNAYKCLLRECLEEYQIHADPKSIQYLATSDCYHAGIHRRRVHFFNIRKWQGEPEAADGFRDLQWFNVNNLPYNNMFPDLALWLPRTFSLPKDGSKVLRVKICFEDEAVSNRITDFSFTVVDRKDGLLRDGL